MGRQIWHVGSAPNRNSQWEQPDIESPSRLSAPGQARGRLMSEKDIVDSITAFASAAANANAKRLGFDVVEIRGAHGYLVDQFFLVRIKQALGQLWWRDIKRTLKICHNFAGWAKKVTGVQMAQRQPELHRSSSLSAHL